MAADTTVVSWEYAQKRRFDPVARVLQNVVPHIRLFFLTHHRTYNSPNLDEVRFWGTIYRAEDAIAREWANKITENKSLLWRGKMGSAHESHRILVSVISELGNPDSPLCHSLQIGRNSGIYNREEQMSCLRKAAGHVLASKGLPFFKEKTDSPRLRTQVVLEKAATGKNPNPREYQQERDKRLIIVGNYVAQDNYITPENVHIYLAEYLHGWPDPSYASIPSGFAFLFLPLSGLGQWRATADWICPMESLEATRKQIRKVDNPPFLLAVEELYSGGLIDEFILSLEEVLSASVSPFERTTQAANVFAQLWIASEILFLRSGSPVRCFSAESDMENVDSTPLNTDALGRASDLLSIEEDKGLVVLNLEELKEGRHLLNVLGFDSVAYRGCPRLAADIDPTQKEMWGLQMREKLERIAATRVREEYYKIHGLSHEFMNILRYRSKYPDLQTKVMNNEKVSVDELLYTFSVLDEMYYLTALIRNTKFKDPREYLLRYLTENVAFQTESFSQAWRKSFQKLIGHFFYGMTPLRTTVVFHEEDCGVSPSCECRALSREDPPQRPLLFPPFKEAVTPVFMAALHEVFGNAVRYTEEKAVEAKDAYAQPLRVDVHFATKILSEDQYYAVRVRNLLLDDSTPGIPDGVTRSEALLSWLTFHDRDGSVRKFVEFRLLSDPLEDIRLGNPRYQCIEVQFRPHLVFQHGQPNKN